MSARRPTNSTTRSSGATNTRSRCCLTKCDTRATSGLARKGHALPFAIPSWRTSKSVALGSCKGCTGPRPRSTRFAASRDPASGSTGPGVRVSVAKGNVATRLPENLVLPSLRRHFLLLSSCPKSLTIKQVHVYQRLSLIASPGAPPAFWGSASERLGSSLRRHFIYLDDGDPAVAILITDEHGEVSRRQ